jgi:hypothetical protein
MVLDLDTKFVRVSARIEENTFSVCFSVILCQKFEQPIASRNGKPIISVFKSVKSIEQNSQAENLS